MRCLIVCRRERGVTIPTKELERIKPVIGTVMMIASQSEHFGRETREAYLFNHGPGPDLLPRLMDAQVTGMSHNGMNISGVEEIDGVLYAQSWWCRYAYGRDV